MAVQSDAFRRAVRTMRSGLTRAAIVLVITVALASSPRPAKKKPETSSSVPPAVGFALEPLPPEWDAAWRLTQALLAQIRREVEQKHLAATGRNGYFKWDSHWTSEGHAVAAHELAACLDRLSAVADGARASAPAISGDRMR